MERIQRLADGLAEGDERAAVLSTIDVLSDAFARMVRASGQFMLDGERQAADLADAAQALRLLRDVGARHGFDFPAGDDDRAVAEYVARFGREVVRMEDDPKS